MSSTARTLAARVLTVLRAIDGTGSYTYDLTDDADRVNYRDMGPAMALPCLDITHMSLDSADAPVMTKYARTLRLHVTGYVGADADTPGAYMLAAADLAKDIHLAIEADRISGGAGSLGAIGHAVNVVSDALDGGSVNIDGCGVVAAVIEVQYRTTTGT